MQVENPKNSDADRNPHDRLMQRAWQNARRAMQLCQQNEGERQKALGFAQQARHVSPSVMQKWIDILNGGHHHHVAILQRAASFFQLSKEDQAWWDQLLQSAPFAPVLRAAGIEQHARNDGQSKRKGQEGMTLEQFDHICRAAAAVAGVKKVHVFGANAILPWLAEEKHPIPLPGFVPSRELDVSVGDDKLDTLIDGAIGELSAFDETFAVYAHGLGLSSFQAPVHWQTRARVRQEPVSGVEIIVPHPYDLIFSKLAAGRAKDFEFANALVPYFPVPAAVQQQLLEEFGAAHPTLIKNLQDNFQRWREILQEQSPPQP
ncbi:MAG: hypothetical protein ACREOO_20575 [bacterium]